VTRYHLDDIRKGTALAHFNVMGNSKLGYSILAATWAQAHFQEAQTTSRKKFSIRLVRNLHRSHRSIVSCATARLRSTASDTFNLSPRDVRSSVVVLGPVLQTPYSAPYARSH
jgi:hypothetical protein